MKKKYYLLMAGMLVFLNFVCWKEVFELSGKRVLKVDFLSVGQGDSAFAE